MTDQNNHLDHDAPHVSGTRIQKIASKQRFNKSSAPDCDTRLSHSRGDEEHGEIWKAENASALEGSNEFVERHGLPLDTHRQF